MGTGTIGSQWREGFARAWSAAAPALAWLKDKLRASPLAALFLVTFAITAFFNPAKVFLTVWGISKLGMGAYLGYWVDRLVFPYARPHTLTGIQQGTAWKRRAWILCAAILAAALIP